MIRIAAIVAAVCVVGAAVALAAVPEAQHAVTPGAEGVPAPLHADAVRIGPTSLTDLAQRAVVRVRVRTGGQVTARLVDDQGAAQPLGPAASAGRGRTVGLRVAAPAAARARGCAEQWLIVDLHDGHGNLTARSRRPLRGAAPACARFFGDRAVWNRELPASAPIDPRSATLVQSLDAQVERNFRDRFFPNINTTAWSVPVYVVPAAQRRVPVRLVGGAAQWGQGLQRALGRGVPIPARARAAAGSGRYADAHIVIYQPATDTMWEFWTARRAKRGWLAGWGGVMHGVSRSPGWFKAVEGVQTGATATSLPLVGGLITLRDLQRGEIDHALAMAIPSSRKNVWSSPAQRTDGVDSSPDAVPAGARFRLDPQLDIDALHLPHFTAMLAHAAQRYGIIVRDTSPAVAFYAQDPTPTGANPWRAALAGGVPQIMRAFPWNRLQAVRAQLWSNGKRLGS